MENGVNGDVATLTIILSPSWRRLPVSANEDLAGVIKQILSQLVLTSQIHRVIFYCTDYYQPEVQGTDFYFLTERPFCPLYFVFPLFFIERKGIERSHCMITWTIWVEKNVDWVPQSLSFNHMRLAPVSNQYQNI